MSEKASEQDHAIVQIPIEQIHPFTDHPFQVMEDEAMAQTVESVKAYGVLTPAIVRPRKEGGFEMISGHRRMKACTLAGIDTIPAIVREMERDAAIILMVDSNIQREHILPSERAKAYKMKMEALKRQAGRPPKNQEQAPQNNSPQPAANFRSDDAVAKDAGVSGDTVRRYIRLTELLPDLLQLVDEKRIGLTPAVELSYLKPNEQELLLQTIDSEQATPSLSQAQRIRALSEQGQLNDDAVLSIMTEQKKPVHDPRETGLTLSEQSLRKYFPKHYTAYQMERTIFKLLETWVKKRKREQER